MSSAVELQCGFHLAVQTSKVTPTGEGVFIPYDLYWGERMRELQAFLKKYHDDAETRFPYMFAPHMPVEVKLEHSRRLREQLSENECSPDQEQS